MHPSRRRRFGLFFGKLAVVMLVGCFFPAWWCGRDAGPLFRGEEGAWLPLAREVALEAMRDVDAESFSTGSARFDGEWALVTAQMTVLGLGQVVTAHPEYRDELLPAIDRAAARLLEPSMRRFGRAAWGEDGLTAHRSPNGHAYLGYVALALGAHRLLRPDSPHVDVHDRLVAAFTHRLERSSTGMIETYPGETFPADVSSVVGAIGLHARATGRPMPAVVEQWGRVVRERYLGDGSGLLTQSVRSDDGAVADGPRASGTAIGAYFVSFADRELSGDLARATLAQRTSFIGFGGVREFPSGRVGRGDIDSGPVLFGVGISSTGFALAGARLLGDAEAYRSIYRTAHLFGVPVSRGDGRWFVTGGPLGNAILLAMLTAGPCAAPREEASP